MLYIQPDDLWDSHKCLVGIPKCLHNNHFADNTANPNATSVSAGSEYKGIPNITYNMPVAKIPANPILCFKGRWRSKTNGMGINKIARSVKILKPPMAKLTLGLLMHEPPPMYPIVCHVFAGGLQSKAYRKKKMMQYTTVSVIMP